ncbi:MAG: hypothetical protein LBR81_05795 [Prevotellaceae bacterium]|nr:hypothetical protein [Prevotellaceae bacterium]
MKKESSAMPHNGNLLEKYIAEQRIVKSHLARRMDITPPSMNLYLTRGSLQTVVWWRISRALQHNFLAELGDALDIAYETKAEAKLREEIAGLQEKIKLQGKEIDEMKVKISVYESIVNK